jgi:mRNA-degrading endonuclease RelE of RelBE toxin-antitoxin system
MSYKITTITPFDRQAKKLAKKFNSFTNDLLLLINILKENPTIGVPLGNGSYKIRMVITSKNKGKSGGARLITHFVVTEKTVVLLAVYDKSEQGSITEKQILGLLKYI